ncbi:Cisplatin resistance-associated overexpressed protein [Nosema bombycis CQ1]|uniref:Cisplatin resistance-associated overexpressed protein n=1 Tax=Nosema bombycis (strain CQ1 / CVCC 102059) TaxID=578461 RepID=R0MLK9_NOSB1|nr:Cisplatin resistance-associated overexpressed protein [Nosema bombycis CQ1]|eukprot:EOB13718.1 Cisplatin resistance-associated overexpressed protein [Nosema bombycis CQ1]
MTDRARILLDKLMGHGRDLNKTTDISKMCIFSMAGLCPYELFVNTKMNLGNCPYKIHAGPDPKLCKKEYELELLRFLVEIHKFITNQNNETPDKNDEILIRERLIDSKLIQIKEKGLSGKVKEALSLFSNLKTEIKELDRIKESYYVNNKDKNMTRCQLCGIKVITNYGSHKFMTHKNGKLHNGVLTVYNKLGELINKFGEEESLKIINCDNLKFFKKN